MYLNRILIKVEYHSGEVTEEFSKLLKQMTFKEKCQFSPFFVRFYSPSSNIIFKIPFESQEELEKYKKPLNFKGYDKSTRKKVMNEFYNQIHSQVKSNLQYFFI